MRLLGQLARRCCRSLPDADRPGNSAATCRVCVWGGGGQVVLGTVWSLGTSQSHSEQHLGINDI
jgi:hypothetical protein